VPDGGRAGAPVRAEIFVIWLDGDRIKLTGPAGAQPWILAIDAGCHPAELVEQAVRDRIGEPLLLHSTSWRHEDAAVTLSFVAVMERSHVEGMASRPIRRSELARADATEPPDEVDPDAVVEHALRHLAWLVQDDPVVRDRLPDRWKAALASYVPEPFRNLA
jgi:hypothetical protein